MKKYVQEKNLQQFFDISIDFFRNRKNKDFFEGIHYFIPPNSSKTKKVVLWHIQRVENWLTGNKEADDEVLSLINRK